LNLYAGLEIAVQVASALAAAHETAVRARRHQTRRTSCCDRKDYAKVLDFGIAKLRSKGWRRDDHLQEKETMRRCKRYKG